MSYTFKPIALCLFTCALQACSSGSSGGFSSGGAAGFTGTVSATGSAIAAATTTDPSDGSIAFADAAPTGGPLVEFDIENDLLTQIRVRDSQVDFQLDLTDPETLFADLPFGLAIATPDFSTVAVFGFDPRNTFEHQSYGAWMTTQAGGAGTAGAGTFGDKTPVADLPVLNGQYRGTGTGIFQDTNGEVFVTSTDVSVWVFPGDERFNLRSSDTVGVNIATGENIDLFELDFRLASAIIDGDINGDVLLADVLDIGLRTGTFTGTMYGPNGEELGALFELSDANSSHIGSVGAVRVTK